MALDTADRSEQFYQTAISLSDIAKILEFEDPRRL